MKITIAPHPKRPDTHKLVKIESRGKVYAAAWAEPFPDEAEVRRAWRENRRVFQPYDESAGTFIGIQ